MERDPMQAPAGRGAGARVVLVQWLRPSTLAGLVLAFLHLGALVCLAVLPLPALALAGAGAVVAVNLLRSLRLHAARSAGRSVLSLTVLENGRWRLGTRAGHVIEARLAETPWVTRSMVVLRLRDEGGWTRAVVILPDMLDGVAFRRLRVFLRVEARSPEMLLFRSSMRFPDR